MQIQNANILVVILNTAFVIFSPQSHGSIAGFADTKKSIFLSATAYKRPLNTGKAVQETYAIRRKFCISTDLPTQCCTSPAPSPWPLIHAWKGRGQSMLCSRPGACRMSSTSLSIPEPGFVNARSLRWHKGRFKATDYICHLPSPWVVSTHSAILKTSGKDLVVGIQCWSADNYYLLY